MLVLGRVSVGVGAGIAGFSLSLPGTWVLLPLIVTVSASVMVAHGGPRGRENTQIPANGRK
ncbi:hypothetical protein GCM10010222_49000 [Streptomyces tanashiensis]|nr:hypothetical protein GCM10010222_49000 [Streptomyces tanashiensis]GGY46933.1 hypothetical protein GCM10010299_61360 [Streptomyces tanashiensis]